MKLDSTYILSSSRLVIDKTFETGVVKIQRSLENQLSLSEKRGCKRLLISPVLLEEDIDVQDEISDVIKAIEEEKRALVSKYKKC